MYQWMKKYLDPICPLFAILPLLSCFGLNMLIYSGTMVMCADCIIMTLPLLWIRQYHLFRVGCTSTLDVFCFGL